MEPVKAIGVKDGDDSNQVAPFVPGMTRSGPAKLPAVLQIDGRRYGVEDLPEEVKSLILDLQQAEAVVLKRRQLVQVMRSAREDLQSRLRQALSSQQPMAEQQPLPEPQAPPAPEPPPVTSPEPAAVSAAAEVTADLDEPTAAQDQNQAQDQKRSVVRRAKDKVKGLFRRFSGGAE